MLFRSVGPYSVSKGRLVRRWQKLDVTPAMRDEWVSKGSSAALDVDLLSWSPAYSKVSGPLPPEDVPTMRLSESAPRVGAVRCWLDVTTAGKVALALNSPEGLEIWVDGKSVEPAERLSLDLGTGLHVVTFALNLSRRREGIRCELEDVAGSAARAQWVGGK